MAERPKLGVALLAAGASRRFGEADKLAANFRSSPLAEHAAQAIPLGLCTESWVITSAAGHACERTWSALGFEPVINPDASKGMGTSVALAAQMAERAGLGALMIVLADMPLVPTEHFAALIAAVPDAQGIAVSFNGTARTPPAVFGASHFAALAALGGDAGARDLLGQGEVIACPPEWLADVDRPEDL